MSKCKCSVTECMKEPKQRTDGTCFPYCWEHREQQQAVLPQQPQGTARDDRNKYIVREACLKSAAMALQAAVASQPMGKQPLSPQQAFELVVEGMKRFEQEVLQE